MRSAAHFKGTREFLTMQKGKAVVESAGESVLLEAGDSVSYHAEVPHAIVNHSRSEALVFLVEIYK